MKRIKIFLLLIMVLLLSGCSGNYNLKINDDLSVEETVSLKVPSTNDTLEKTTKLFEDNNISKDKYDIVASDNDVKITYSEKYDSIEEYILDSKLYKNLFDNINYEKNENYFKLSTNSVFSLNGKNSNNIVDNYDISLLQINVETPYKIIENNADNVSDGLYSWVLNSKTTYKNIYFTLSADNKTRNFASVIVLSIMAFIVIGTIIVFASRFINRKKL